MLRRPIVPLVVCLVLLLGACAPRPHGSTVAAPPLDAEPAHVVQALIDAVNAGDRELARELATTDFWVETWIASGATIRDARIGRTTEDGWTMYDDAVRVAVDFTPWGTDASMTSGVRRSWGFFLTREVDGSWRVFDSGAG